MVRVVVYSDQPILAKGLERLIDADPALELTAWCENVLTLKDHMANVWPDVAVVDLTPQITIPVLGELQSLTPGCRLILWTTSVAPEFALQAMAIGVRGILRKTLPLEALRQCLHKVHSGELWFEKSLTDSFKAASRVALSPRESQLVNLLSRGLPNKEISALLGITEGTVKVYLNHLFQKSGAKDRFDLALLGLKNLHMAGVSTEVHGGLRSLLLDRPLCTQ
jgi:two-component system, NarL family, nitrate/nitrite response regulator NarL